MHQCLFLGAKNSTQPPTGIQSIVQRARNLIGTNMSGSGQNGTASHPPKRRKISSRAYIPTKKVKADEMKTFELVLLRSAGMICDDDSGPIIPDYNKTEDDVLCTGMVDISTSADEKNIRCCIQEVLVNRFPDLEVDAFDFTKVKGKKVTTPIFKSGQDIGYRGRVLFMFASGTKILVILRLKKFHAPKMKTWMTVTQSLHNLVVFHVWLAYPHS